MAVTYPYRGVKVKAEDSFLSAIVREAPEAASQTFPIGAPLIFSSGLVAEEAATVDLDGDVIGFAARAGQNGTGKVSSFIPAFAGIEFFANFLNNANPHNTTNAIAAADVGGTFEIQKDTNIVGDGGAAVWHVADVGTTAAALMVSLQSDHTPENQLNAGGAQVADLNARVLFRLMDAARVGG